MNKYIKSGIILFLFLTGPSEFVIAKSKAEDYKFHTPAEFMEILRKSEIAYTVKLEEKILPTNLVPAVNKSRFINPYSRIIRDKNGNDELITDKPTGEILKIFELAAEKLQKKEFEEVRKLYEQALKIDDNYFKTWVNLGDTYYWLGKYDKAEKNLLKAIELNDIDYQAYYFLAEVYFKSGDSQTSLECITYAFMLNKNNPNIKTALKRILKRNGLKLRKDRLKFPFEIKKIDKKQCEINLQKKNGSNWMAMAICLACWQMEPSFQKLLNDEQDSINNKVTMYKECISNQFAVIVAKKEQNENITPKELQFYEMVKNNYINAILYWEIIATEAPQIILLLPKDERDRFVQYIRTYVFEEESSYY